MSREDVPLKSVRTCPICGRLVNVYRRKADGQLLLRWHTALEAKNRRATCRGTNTTVTASAVSAAEPTPDWGVWRREYEDRGGEV